MSITTINPDLAKERHGNLEFNALKQFLADTRFNEPGEHKEMIRIRDDIMTRIKPVSEENFFNLNRDERYQLILKKSLEVCEYGREKNLDLPTLLKFPIHAIFGPEKFTFGLHVSAFVVPIDLWGTDSQREFWKREIQEKPIFGTYVQTEVGHGTNVRGLETTATYDKSTKEFVIDSPTPTATKFWPGASAKTCNYALVMAQLVIDGQHHGMHAFIVQLRSLDNHKLVPNLETGDIGMKNGFDTQDNGFLKFHKLRIPLQNMLMRNAVVTPEGEFKRVGNEMVMYACMLILRAILAQISTLNCAVTTTIAIRYSCVRRQTAGADGVTEPQIIEYKTQQYRLFPALAHSYAYYFASCRFIQFMAATKDSTNNFLTVNPIHLNKIHAVTSAMKAMSFTNALKFSQANRFCCGGHGYSLASGIPQVIQDLDAGSTYEGDNVVLLLQTARFLLKCAQKDTNPHLELENERELKASSVYKQFAAYFDIYYKLYEECISEITSKMMYLITEKGLSNLEAWNESSVLLINASKVYVNIYVINCFLSAIHSNQVAVNRKALCELFELFMLYDICDNFAGNILRFNIIESSTMTQFGETLNELLSKIRVNAVLLVDAFDFLDANLCSALGAYDGRAYERLMEFAEGSQFNKTEIHEAYEKYQKPYKMRLERSSKL